MCGVGDEDGNEKNLQACIRQELAVIRNKNRSERMETRI